MSDDLTQVAEAAIEAYSRQKDGPDNKRRAAYLAAIAPLGVSESQDDLRLTLIERIRQTEPDDFQRLGLESLLRLLAELKDAGVKLGAGGDS
jgi:hypothetical protein